jgi:hypothetical protein
MHIIRIMATIQSDLMTIPGMLTYEQNYTSLLNYELSVT